MKNKTVWRLVILSCAGFWLSVGVGCAYAKPVQQIKAAHIQTRTYKGYGVEVKVKSNNWVEVDGSPAAIIEQAEKATVYQSGLFNITVYKSGKVALLKEGVFVGWLKQVK